MFRGFVVCFILVVRGLVFITFYCVDLLVFIVSLVGGWLAYLVI